jgi:hypothetical protein
MCPGEHGKCCQRETVAHFITEPLHLAIRKSLKYLSLVLHLVEEAHTSCSAVKMKQLRSFDEMSYRSEQ